ncbi:MAG: sugar phosphate isomerase/epimerase [Planctomycetota bacterium]
MPRRKFLHATAAAGAAVLVQSAPARADEAQPKPRVGSQLYGWTQYYQRDKKKWDMDEVLSAIREAGYDYAEGSMDSGTPANNAKLAELMKSKGLTPVCLYTGGRLIEEAKAKETVQRLLAAAKVCGEAGFTVINCNPDPIGRAKTDDELKTQAAALQEFGEGLLKLNMRLGIHNHTPEMQNGAKEFHTTFKLTDPKAVGFNYDVHWVYRGGIQPADALRDYGARVVSWHLRQSRDKVWWEDLDTGDIDYAAIAAYVKEHKLPQIYSVELALEGGTKITRSALENHRRSREFVRQVFGV